MANPVLSLSHLSRSFGALKANADISLDLRRGEIHAIIGPNGAGKSTLIAQIAGSLRPDSGTITFLGKDVTTLGPAARARAGLGRSFQISAILPEASVLQNIMLAALAAQGRTSNLFTSARTNAEAHETATREAGRVGLARRHATRASDLAHGERRRLELAMALALDPRAFLLDEPLAGMGAEGSAAMTEILNQLRHRAPILLVEHDMQAVFALADRITVLENGRVLATGTPAEIRENTEVRRAYLGEDAL